MLILDQLASAIESRTPVVVEYRRHGKTPGPRHGHPYAIFMLHTKAHPEGRWYLGWWQTGGASEQGELPDWRQLILDEVIFIAAEECEGPFPIQDSYKPESKQYNHVYAQV